MNIEELKAAATQKREPDGLSPCVRALWLDACGDWDGAHALVQSQSSEDASWVHAYLHRKEGDFPNARYWYQRAGRSPCETTLDQEWTDIATALL